MKKLITALFATISLFSVSAHSTEYSAYKWVDANGETNYGDEAPHTVEVKSLSLQDNVISSDKNVPVYNSGLGGSGNVRTTEFKSALNDRYSTAPDRDNIFKKNDTGNSFAVKTTRIQRYTSKK